MNRFKRIFGDTKPIITMLHLKQDAEMSMMDRAKKEIDIYYKNGIDAVLVENYFGSSEDCETVLAYLQKEYADKIYGVNILGDYVKAFKLADKYGAKFIQIDSVCGHLYPEEDIEYAAELKSFRDNSNTAVLGGVRFKYQPIHSGRTVAEDLELGKNRCDAIVVTGEGTGTLTPEDKMKEFRLCLGDFPLVTGAGVTKDILKGTLEISDGVIVGSWLKDDHDAFGNVNEEYVKMFNSERI